MKQSLWNSGWLFWEEKDAFALLWATPESAKPVTLPHDAMLLKDPTPDALNRRNTGFREGGGHTATPRP